MIGNDAGRAMEKVERYDKKSEMAWKKEKHRSHESTATSVCPELIQSVV